MPSLRSCALIFTLLGAASCAYVRSEPCADYDAAQPKHQGVSIDSLQASYHEELLTLQVGVAFDGSQNCDVSQIEGIQQISVSGNGISSSQSSNFTCLHDAASNFFPGGYGVLTTVIPTHGEHWFNTFDVNVSLLLDNAPLGCTRGAVTPVLPESVVATVKYVPISILILTVLVSVVDAYNRRHRHVLSAVSGSDSAEALIPGFCDCLQYIQFIFLTGCLNLQFPDYLRVTVGQASWSTLLNPLVYDKNAFRYNGIEDGIYEFNSTSGFEGMTQILGVQRVPMLWRNILINSGIAMAAAGIFVLAFGVFEKWKGSRNERQFSFTIHLQRVGWSVLRVAFNYFSVPVIAFNWFMLTTYLSPIHTRIICALILLGIAIALIVAMRRLMDQNRGYIFLTDATSTRHTVRLSMSTFAAYEFYIAIFIRGSVFGIVQLPGVVQIPLLAVNEIILLITLLKVWPAGSGKAKQLLFTTTRLFVLISCVVYVIPGPQHDALGYAFAYIIMGFHAFALLVGSLGFAICSLCRGALKTGKDRKADNEPQIVNLYQLSYRHNRGDSFDVTTKL